MGASGAAEVKACSGAEKRNAACGLANLLSRKRQIVHRSPPNCKPKFRPWPRSRSGDRRRRTGRIPSAPAVACLRRVHDAFD